jgi:hypothetical protein
MSRTLLIITSLFVLGIGQILYQLRFLRSRVRDHSAFGQQHNFLSRFLFLAIILLLRSRPNLCIHSTPDTEPGGMYMNWLISLVLLLHNLPDFWFGPRDISHFNYLLLLERYPGRRARSNPLARVK